MKNILIIITLITSINTFSQTISVNPTRNDFLGTWEWQNNNVIFRVNFFNESDGDGTFSLGGHFTMLESDNNGNETILFTSDRPIENTNQNWLPMINGGRYLDYIDSYRFSLRDNTTNDFLLGTLDLKFLDVPNGSPLQISWKLRIDGMANEDQNFNVPTDITLTKVE
jgi:hypothetical protein